jgi:hypothetical protein
MTASRGVLRVLVVLTFASTATADATTSPVQVVDRQLAAYNAKNLEAFLACYAPTAELFELPDKPLAKGTAALRERYAQRFADPILHATLANRIVMGNKVIDHEQIRRTWPEGPGNWEAVAIYEVEGGLIVRTWFILGEKKIDAKK